LISTSGASISSNGFVVEYALGEVSIVTVSNTNSVATQGLLQPQIKIVNPDCDIINQKIKIFENPTINIARIVSIHNWISFYQVYATDGKLIRSEPFTNNHINLTNLPAAPYFIKLLPGCDGKYRVLKIIKK
jgi:hypothetical protein